MHVKSVKIVTILAFFAFFVSSQSFSLPSVKSIKKESREYQQSCVDTPQYKRNIDQVAFCYRMDHPRSPKLLKL